MAKDPRLGKLVRIKEKYWDNNDNEDYISEGGLLWFRITDEEAMELTNGESVAWVKRTKPYKSLATGFVAPFWIYEMEEFDEEANYS